MLKDDPDVRSRVFQGRAEPDAGAAAAAGRGVPGLSARRSGEGTQKKGGAGAKTAGGRGGTPDPPSRGAEAEGGRQNPCFCSIVTSGSGRVCNSTVRVCVCVCFCPCSQTLAEEKERKSECLPPEPPQDDPDCLEIMFKLPNDTRVKRRFLFSQSLTVNTHTPLASYILDMGMHWHKCIQNSRLKKKCSNPYKL